MTLAERQQRATWPRTREFSHLAARVEAGLTVGRLDVGCDPGDPIAVAEQGGPATKGGALRRKVDKMGKSKRANASGSL